MSRTLHDSGDDTLTKIIPTSANSKEAIFDFGT